MPPLPLSADVPLDGPAAVFLAACLPMPDDHRAVQPVDAPALLGRHAEALRHDLWAAATSGQAEAVRALLVRRPDRANALGGPWHWPPLLYLAFSRFLRDPDHAPALEETARLLLAAGADPNASWREPDGPAGVRASVLYGAAGVANRPTLAALLIAHGADPNDGETAYHMVEHDGVPCAGAVFPHLDAQGRSIALAHKLDYDDLPGVQALLALGADPNAPTPFPNRALHQAVWRDRALPFFETLLAHGADLNVPDAHGRTAYTLAARTGRLAIADWLTAAGADPVLTPDDAFLAACARGNAPDDLERAARLAVHESALVVEMAAIGNTAGVAALLDAGWPVNALGPTWGETALHRAALGGHPSTAEVLYARGADLTIRDRSYHSTPLGWALHEGHTALARRLAADPERLDLRDAASAGYAARIRPLLAGVDPNAAVLGGDPGVLLRDAVLGGHLGVVQVLLDAGADPDVPNRYGVSARLLAARSESAALRTLLSTRSGAG